MRKIAHMVPGTRYNSGPIVKDQIWTTAKSMFFCLVTMVPTGTIQGGTANSVLPRYVENSLCVSFTDLKCHEKTGTRQKRPFVRYSPQMTKLHSKFNTVVLDIPCQIIKWE